jgi:hypothetical protein
VDQESRTKRKNPVGEEKANGVFDFSGLKFFFEIVSVLSSSFGNV